MNPAMDMPSSFKWVCRNCGAGVVAMTKGASKLCRTCGGQLSVELTKELPPEQNPLFDMANDALRQNPVATIGDPVFTVRLLGVTPEYAIICIDGLGSFYMKPGDDVKVMGKL